MRPEFSLAAAGLHTDDPTAPISQASRAQSSDLPANPYSVPQPPKLQPPSTNLYHKKRFHNLFAYSFLPFPSRNNKEFPIFAEGKNRCSVKLEFFIARRIASSAGRDGHNVMVRVATATVATGVAVMIVALAVITGFRREITSKIIGFDAQIQLTNLDSNSSLERTPITASPTLEQRIAEIDGVTTISKFAVKGGIIRTDEAIQGVMLKGVDQNYDSTFFKQNLIAGSLPRTDGRQLHKDLLISESLASMLKLDTASRAEMLFVYSDGRTRRDLFKVCGIYSSGMSEMDDMVVLTELGNVQRINNWDQSLITGYEISTSDFRHVAPITDLVNQCALEVGLDENQQLFATDIMTRYPMIFDWLKTHNINAMIIIIIMLVVALMNMISAMLIILLERTRMIGILKSLGMRNGQIRSIFLWRSLYIVGRGVVYGNIAGLALCAAQHWGHLIKLDPTGYMISEVPISIGIGWWMVLNVATIIIIVALMILPASIISFIKPETTVRYQ